METKQFDWNQSPWAAYFKAQENPLETLSTAKGMTEFMGAVNQLTYGINPYTKAEFTPLMESDEKREDDEDHDDVQKPVEDEPYWPSQEEIDN
jgi:hypothetical protein